MTGTMLRRLLQVGIVMAISAFMLVAAVGVSAASDGHGRWGEGYKNAGDQAENSGGDRPGRALGNNGEDRPGYGYGDRNHHHFGPPGLGYGEGNQFFSRVSTAAATHFAVSAPDSVTSGSAFSITVTALDANNIRTTAYTGTVHFITTASSASLPGDTTLTNGIGTFSATLNTTGNQTITATDTVTASITGTSGVIDVSPAGLHFAVSAPSSATAGNSFTFTVTAQDASNNTVTNYGGTVQFTSSDGSAALPGNSTLTNGAATFSATLNTVGNQTITATDTSNSAMSGTSNTIVVSAAAGTHFVVTALSSATAGTAFNVTVTAVDQNGATLTNYAGTVHFSSSDGLASLPGNTTLSGGTGTFQATLKTAGNQTITATDTVTLSINGTSNTISVAPTYANHFAVSAPATASQNEPFNFSVTALDPFGNTATAYGGTVKFSSSDSSASLPANSTLNSGTGTFSATLKTTGNQTITATDVASSFTGMSGTITVGD
ncbi:MAG: hypothetical protein M1337_06630 [Actinobacteria bacterium]|nr:hypothetical protein [Actinomycetota bacterium]